jgi:hypothetical protein
VLFSDPRVSAFVREHFVAAWQSVRTVPLVEIDFGNGLKLKRTVNGNVATYVCSPDGRVLDIIPGLNTPEAYLEDLRYALNLYRASFANLDRLVPEYHRSNLAEPTRYEWVFLDTSKDGVERVTKSSVGLGIPVKVSPSGAVTDKKKREVERPVRSLAAEDARLLASDTETNRKERKPLVHRLLSEKVVRPAEVTKRVYKEILHCDLDDPYLGLVSGAFGGGAYEDR